MKTISEILKSYNIPELYTTEALEMEDTKVYAQILDPVSKWQWYITEYDHSRLLAFGFVIGFESEFGYIDIKELEETDANLEVNRVDVDMHTIASSTW